MQRGTRKSRQSGEEIKVGHVVIVEDEDLPRGFWKLGVVVKLLIGRDEMVRAAVVRTHTKNGRPTELRRPVQKLFPLEVQERDESGEAIDDSTSEGGVNEEPRIVPRRAAALKARERLRLWAKELCIDSN
jgi:hypothetical protein